MKTRAVWLESTSYIVQEIGRKLKFVIAILQIVFSELQFLDTPNTTHKLVITWKRDL